MNNHFPLLNEQKKFFVKGIVLKLIVHNTKLQNHLKFACKPRVKLSEQSLTISYERKAQK